jgi:hypothetical protein
MMYAFASTIGMVCSDTEKTPGDLSAEDLPPEFACASFRLLY